MTSSGKTRPIEAQTVFFKSAFSLHLYYTWFLNCAESENSVFCRCTYVTKSPDSDQNARCLIRACSLCPAISRVFQMTSKLNNVLYCCFIPLCLANPCLSIHIFACLPQSPPLTYHWSFNMLQTDECVRNYEACVLICK